MKNLNGLCKEKFNIRPTVPGKMKSLSGKYGLSLKIWLQEIWEKAIQNNWVEYDLSDAGEEMQINDIKISFIAGREKRPGGDLSSPAWRFGDLHRKSGCMFCTSDFKKIPKVADVFLNNSRYSLIINKYPSANRHFLLVKDRSISNLEQHIRSEKEVLDILTMQKHLPISYLQYFNCLQGKDETDGAATINHWHCQILQRGKGFFHSGAIKLDKFHFIDRRITIGILGKGHTSCRVFEGNNASELSRFVYAYLCFLNEQKIAYNLVTLRLNKVIRAIVIPRKRGIPRTKAFGIETKQRFGPSEIHGHMIESDSDFFQRIQQEAPQKVYKIMVARLGEIGYSDEEIDLFDLQFVINLFFKKYKKDVCEIVSRVAKENVPLDLRNPSIVELLRVKGRAIGEAHIIPPFILHGISPWKIVWSFFKLAALSNKKKSKGKYFDTMKELLIFPTVQKNPLRYHARQWKHDSKGWIQQRIVFQKGQTDIVRSYPLDSWINSLFIIIETTTADSRGFEIFRFLLESEISNGKKIYAVFNNLLENQEIYQLWPSCTSIGEFKDVIDHYVPQKETDVKAVNQFCDITLLYQTAPIDQIPSLVELKNNPIIALPAMGRKMWELIDGHRSIQQIYTMLKKEYGNRINQQFTMGLLKGLLTLGYLKRMGQEKAIMEETVTFQNEWDFDVSIVQKSLNYADLPFYVLLELTERCTRNCIHCYKAGELKDEEMDDATFLNKLVVPVINSGVGYVTLLGGEPLLRKKLLFKTIKLLKENHIYTKIITNGDLLDMGTISALDKAKLNKIELSLDGFMPEVNDCFRGNNSFQNVVNALRNLQTSSIAEIGISVTVSSWNVDEIMHDFVGFVRQFPRLTKAYFSRYYKSTCQDGFDGIAELTGEKIDQLKKQILIWEKEFADRKHFEAVILDEGACSCGRTMALVTPQGRIKPCPFIKAKGGELSANYSFKELWHESFLPLRSGSKRICWTRMMRDKLL